MENISSSTVVNLPADAEAARVQHLNEVNARRRALLYQQNTGKSPEQAAAEQEENMRRLKAAIEHGKELRDEYDRLAPGVEQAKRDRTGYLLQHRNAVANLREKQRPLDPLTFPSDAQVKKHDAELRAARELVAAIEEKFHDADRRAGGLLDCIKLAQAIQQQQYVVRNLRTLCEGGMPGTIQGGISTAGDFIGNLQTPMR
jgi:hypothetical protein